MAKIVTRREFAALIGVRPDTVKRYVSRGKLTPPAVVRDNGRVFVNVALAKRQLRQTLAAPTRGRALTGGARLDDGEGCGGATVEARIKSELLRKLRIDNERAERAERAAARQGGRYVRSDAVAAMCEKAAQMTLKLIEAQADAMATEIARQLRIPVGEVDPMMMKLFEKARQVASESLRGTRPGFGAAH